MNHPTGISEIFETMEYGPAPEAEQPALEWITRHGGEFGLYVGGRWVKGQDGRGFDVINPATRAKLARVVQAGPADVSAVGQIIPWNFPLLMVAWKVAPALAAGCTVVLKPAEFTPLTALAFAELAHEAGLPAGVLNVITGDGESGKLLVDHPDVDKIAFTGSTDVGRNIRQATAGTGKNPSLARAGKSPFIVFEDADLDSVVEGVVDVPNRRLLLAGDAVHRRVALGDDRPGRDLRSGAGLHDVPYPRRSGGARQQHPVRPGGERVDRKHQPRPRYRA